MARRSSPRTGTRTSVVWNTTLDESSPDACSWLCAVKCRMGIVSSTRRSSAGAVAVVTDSPIEKPREGVAWALVPHGRRALARLSANFYRHPAERIAITGITGTNGKSTTAFLVESILTAAGRKSALIGTIEYHVAGRIYPAPHTTPEALELARLLHEALGLGATDAVMEVSSHALAQERVFGVPFDVAIFTNLTRDHLDYHKTMDEYFAAKRVLFEGCGTDAPRVGSHQSRRRIWRQAGGV